ncbi:MAG: hypothetical protein QGI75_00790 [Phycisphaerales bacterium]|jgi:hypothetical protein|nr:hypothetical protein [Phycisphaerales bacterium]
MSRQSATTLSRTIATGAMLLATATASAALVKLNLVQHVASPNGWDANTWRLYAEFDDPNDQLTSVYSSIPWITYIVAPEGFYQNLFGGPTAASINEAFAPLFPTLGYDSWITIGGEWSSECGTLSTTNLDFSYFEDSTNVPGVLATLTGHWDRPVNDPYAFGTVISGMPNYQVLLGQFTTFGTPAETGPFGRLNLKGYSWSFGVNGGELVQWSVQNLSFGPDPANVGACCIDGPDGSWCDMVVETVCTHVGGSWQGANTACDDVNCGELPDEGACCYPHAAFGMVCEVMPADSCAAVSGFFYGGGSVCSDPFVECDPLPVGGACCYDHEMYGMVCEVMSEEDCAALPQGFFYGDGTVCSDVFVECPTLPGPGACCYENSVQEMVCEQMLEPACGDLGGYWYGSGITCDDPIVECESPQYGACCVEDLQNPGTWNCIETTVDDCLDNVGIWYGDSTLCSDSGIDCNVGHNCTVVPGSECARAPQYDAADYQVFGEGPVAVQTAAPTIGGGRVLTVFDLSDLDTAPFDAPFSLNRYARFNWDADNLGSILGLALDEDGNIFVTASQTWNADVMGPAGWGAVYRIDTYTGAISTFVVIGTPNSSLGSITYDCQHDQFFVSSFEDGIIYRIDHTTGAVQGTYDPAAPYAGGTGPIALGDRPFGLEVNGDRLYYSLWNEDMFNASSLVNNEIWSVELDGTGNPIASTETLEIVLPDLHAFGSEMYSSPVADIDFSPTGTMILGERTQGDITTLIATHARVLEYECVDGTWMPSTNVFHIGENYVSYANAAGGVDANETNVWASADAMHLGSGGDLMWGMQGLPRTGGTIANSFLIDYNDDLVNHDTAEMGDLVVAPRVGDNGGSELECPTIDDASILCVNSGPPAQYGITFYISNMDDSDTITGVNMSVPTLYSLSPANVSLSIPPNANGAFASTLTGGSPGDYFCIDMEIVFQSGESCTDTVCFTLPDCIIIVDPPGDFNGDGLVNVDDLMMLIGRWGEVCDGNDNDCLLIDLDDSGVIDMGDLLALLGNWTI